MTCAFPCLLFPLPLPPTTASAHACTRRAWVHLLLSPYYHSHISAHTHTRWVWPCLILSHLISLPPPLPPPTISACAHTRRVPVLSPPSLLMHLCLHSYKTSIALSHLIMLPLLPTISARTHSRWVQACSSPTTSAHTSTRWAQAHLAATADYLLHSCSLRWAQARHSSTSFTCPLLCSYSVLVIVLSIAGPLLSCRGPSIM